MPAAGSHVRQAMFTIEKMFGEWSRGADIRSATVAVLAEFKDHLQNGQGVWE